MKNGLPYEKKASACNIAKSINPPWVFSTFLELYKWYQVAQSILYNLCSIVFIVSFELVFQQHRSF